MKMKRAFSVSVAVLAGIPAVFAHAGHGPMESDLMHYLTSPAHLAGAIVLLIVGVVIMRRVRSRVVRKVTT